MVTLLKALVAIPVTILRGFVIRLLWAWLLVSTFPTMPQITTMQAIGLVVLLGAVRAPHESMADRAVHDAMSESEKDHLFWVQTAESAFRSLVLLGVGAVLHWIG